MLARIPGARSSTGDTASIQLTEPDPIRLIETGAQLQTQPNCPVSLLKQVASCTSIHTDP